MAHREGDVGLKPRKPLAAFLLAFLSTPAGFLYVGRPGLALAFATLPFLAILLAGQTGLVFTLAGWAVLVAAALSIALASFILPPILAARSGSTYELRRYNRWYVYVLLIAVYATFSSFLATHRGALAGFEAYRIPSGAMQNTLQIGDFIVGDTRDLSGLKRSDIVTFKRNGTVFIKRLVALPGDTIEIRDCRVVLNGVPIEEPYALIESTRRADDSICASAAVQLPPGELFLLGDNRRGSMDSRAFGPVAVGDVNTIARMVWFARDFSRIGQRLD